MKVTEYTRLLVFDQGNTLVKLGLFVDGILVDHKQYESSANEDLSKYIEELRVHYPDCQFFGISSGDSNALPEIFQEGCATREQIKGPLEVSYKTPKTLGIDRLAMASSANLEYGGDVLVVTMGTCITYNIVKKSSFLGGAISPGWAMRYRAMHEFTAGLPLATFDESSALLGVDTHGSLRAGVDIAVQVEVEGMIERYCQQYDIKCVVLCGGDAKRLSKPLKKYIFAPANYELHALKRLHEYIETTGPL